MQAHTLECGTSPGEQVGTQESTVGHVLDLLNPVSPPPVTHSFNKYLLSHCVLGTKDKVFAHMELAVESGRPIRNKKTIA